MKPKSHSLKIPLPPPEVRAAQKDQMLKAGLQKAAQMQEERDVEGAITTFLEAIAVVWKRVPITDHENRDRIYALAEQVFARSQSEIPGPASAKRMVDRIIEAVDADWSKRGLG